MSAKRRRSKRQPIDLEQLKNDPNSFLSWGIEDPVLRKLETYRLYQGDFAVADIAEAFGFARGYLYEMWAKLEDEGTVALVDKRWGTEPRKRTTEKEAAVLRAKALDPKRGDTDLAREFELDRTTVYELLKEHDLQDLHRVVSGTEPTGLENASSEAGAEDGEKGGSKSSPVSPPSS